MGTPEQDDEIVRFFMRHVVALNIAYEKPDGTRTREACTCLVLEMRREWFLVTAGHILEDRYSALPHCKNVETSLFDAWHAGASRFPVPFRLLNAKHFAFCDKKLGLDLGLVHLEPFYRRQLEANGIKAFDETAWRNPPREMLAHVLIGLPEQFTEARTTAEGIPTVAVLPTLVYLNAADPPAGMETPFPRFYGNSRTAWSTRTRAHRWTKWQGSAALPSSGSSLTPTGR
jgi:hypothetical protein